jgi:Uma2 family endonuclease
MVRPEAIRHRPLTVEEYLALEDESSVRHEYVAGQIFAFAGAKEAHNLIVANLITALRTAARNTPCRVYPSDMLLRAADDAFYYPDVMTVCDPEDTNTAYKTRPCTVIEVLSPSTSSTDQREKLLAYRRIPSLKAYIIVYQDEMRVKTVSRDAQGAWWESEVAGEGNVLVPCPEIELTLSDIYEDVFPVAVES